MVMNLFILSTFKNVVKSMSSIDYFSKFLHNNGILLTEDSDLYAVFALSIAVYSDLCAAWLCQSICQNHRQPGQRKP